VEPKTQITQFLIHLNLIFKLSPVLCIDTTNFPCWFFYLVKNPGHDNPRPTLIQVLKKAQQQPVTARVGERLWKALYVEDDL
jgi:hypothetical protein